MGWIIFFQALGVLLTLLVGAVLVGVVYFYRLAIPRSAKDKTAEECAEFWGEYAPAVKEGIAYFRSLEPETVCIKSYDGLALTGYYAGVENPAGAVLIMHGYRSNALCDHAAAFEYYRKKRFCILTVDQRSHGKSEGKYITYGVKERYDCKAWCEWLVSRNGSALPIYLHGVSMGCATVLMAAGLELPCSVSGIIADCGFTSPKAIFNHILKRDYKLPPFPLVPLTGLAARIFSGFNINACTTVQAIKEAEIPILFFHGEKDTFVPLYMTEENYSAARHGRLVVVPAVAHAQSMLISPERYFGEIDGFFKI